MSTTKPETGTLAFNEITPGDDVGFPNARKTSGLSKASIKGLAADIAGDRGLLNPLLIWIPDAGSIAVDDRLSGKKVLIAANRRYLAIQLIIEEGVKTVVQGEEKTVKWPKSKELPVRYVYGDYIDARIDALAENVQREDLSTYELASEILLLQGKGLSQKEVAERVNMSVPWVSTRVNAYQRAGKALKEAWRDRKVTDTDAVNIALNNESEKVQEKKLAEVLELRSEGSKASRGKAGAKAKGRKNPAPSRHEIDQMLEDLKPVKASQGILYGMRIGIEWAKGELGLADLPKEFTAYMKPIIAERNDAMAEKAEKVAKEREVKAAAKKTKAAAKKKASKPAEAQAAA